MRKRSFPPPRAPGRQADGPRSPHAIGGFIPSSKQVSSAGKDTLEAEASTQHDVEASRARTPSPAGKAQSIYCLVRCLLCLQCRAAGKDIGIGVQMGD
eukprot:g19045.t1